MRKLASIRLIEELSPIENADFIEKARIGGWWVVVKKGDFKVGDKCIYIECDSFIKCHPAFDFLLKGSSVKTMLYTGENVSGIRLKTKKLKGVVSQGLIVPILLLNQYGTVTSSNGDLFFEEL